MKSIVRLAFFLLVAATFNAQAQEKFPGKTLSLIGEPAVTVFKNESADTLKIKGMFFNWLPYVETNFDLRIPPSKQDSLTLLFNFLDHIAINGTFRILNAPGKRVVCTVRSIKPKATDVEFEGDLHMENTYLLSYSNFLGINDNESRAYYNMGDKIKDFNLFPAIADSITKVRTDFLERYSPPVSPWFKRYEYDRLMYNGMMRKDNVLISKRFYRGKPIPVNDNYYDFEKDLSLKYTGEPITTEFLWTADTYLFRQAEKKKIPGLGGMLKMTDSIAGNTSLADVIKTRRLGTFYTHKREDYEREMAVTKLSTTVVKTMVDSIIQARLGFPKVGKKAPDMTLKDIDGKTVSLASFAGHPVIINFWAEWCGPCKAEFPMENKLYQQYKDKGLVIINICLETKEESWKAITKRDDLQMVNLFADAESYKKIKAAYNIGAIPRSIAIGKDQKVIANYYQRASLLKDADIAALLKN
ncbi:TlpA family protein disulfide reductase [Mucilaginibacter myungsuensis]|uniref:TlpA family protein disulfide reductase n=1 Tax=Mucilaginibacter myungsuensis TaxID=649104 RepID=A0A929KZ41_9SPHI|nr:TlpA disulfide reductase family protein [Mucilaginibacter myungsuensis]MBE9664359.1 TlpA family protein disulfide reductase [Mucilaginibacter myungsuensis]MDN3597069.1 TlpA disulfide reductase family protein [Mucilaginibacter myungsuensis]